MMVIFTPKSIYESVKERREKRNSFTAYDQYRDLVGALARALQEDMLNREDHRTSTLVLDRAIDRRTVKQLKEEFAMCGWEMIYFGGWAFWKPRLTIKILDNDRRYRIYCTIDPEV